MTINYRREDKARQFNSLDPGDTFIFSGCVYLKINDFERAVNLENGELQYFGLFCPVTLVNAELNIR